MPRFISLLLLLISAGCASSSKYSPVDMPVSLGMSKADLKSYFGAPVKITKEADGGECWYYRFGEVKRSVERKSFSERQGDSISAGYGIAWTSTSLSKLPVFLSPEGFVIEPVPPGTVARTSTNR